MNNDILIIIYRDNYEDMFRAMNELMNYDYRLYGHHSSFVLVEGVRYL